jgi:OOP family OmpA-OmpF porin
MNKTLILATAATLALGAAAARADDGLYIGGSVARPSWKDSVNGIGGSESGTGLKVYGGWALNPNFALEAGAVQLGKLGNGVDEAKARGYTLDAVGTLPLSGPWSLLGRVGLGEVKTITTLGSDRGTALKTGLGLQYQLNKSVALRGEWERYRLHAFDSHPDVDQLSLGVKFGF